MIAKTSDIMGKKGRETLPGDVASPIQDIYRAEEVMSRVLAIELPGAIQTEIRLHAMGVRRCPHSLATARDRKERSTAHNTWNTLFS